MEIENAPQSINQQSTPTNTTIQPHKSKKMWIIATVILALLIFSIGGYTLGANTNDNLSASNVTQVSKSIPTVITSPVTENQASNEEVNLTTYTNSTLNISFNYPETWRCTTADRNNGPGPEVIECISNKSPESDYGPLVTIDYDVNDYDSIAFEYSQHYTYTSISALGLNGVLKEYSAYFGGGGSYILDHNGKAIEFNFIEKNGKNYSQEAKKIMDSFKFLNAITPTTP